MVIILSQVLLYSNSTFYWRTVLFDMRRCKGTLDYPPIETPYPSCVCGSPTLPRLFLLSWKIHWFECWCAYIFLFCFLFLRPVSKVLLQKKNWQRILVLPNQWQRASRHLHVRVIWFFFLIDLILSLPKVWSNYEKFNVLPLNENTFARNKRVLNCPQMSMPVYKLATHTISAGWGTMIVTYMLVFGISGAIFAATFWMVRVTPTRTHRHSCTRVHPHSPTHWPSA